MNKAVLPLVFAVFFSGFCYAQTLMYSWRDQTGKLHIVDDLNKVPVEYREDVKTYRVFPGRERKGPRPRIPPRPITTVREAEEETEETSREERSGEEIGEVRTSITQLEDRLEELREERRVKWRKMIRERGRGKIMYRQRREIERIDQEIETLTDQLERKTEGLRSLEGEGKEMR
jgi:hypothetical protein